MADADPDDPRMTEAARQIARQFGVYAPAVDYAAAMDDLY
jgi:hypothetical protein